MEVSNSGTVKRIGDKYNGVRVTLDESCKPQISLFYYPYYINNSKSADTQIAENSESFVKLSQEGLTIEVFEAYARPLSGFPEIVDIIIGFASYKIIEGFFNGIGTDLWKKFAHKIIEITPIRKDSLNRDIKTNAHICYTTTIENTEVTIKIAFESHEIEKIGFAPYTMQSINSYVRDIFVDYQVKEILLGIIPDSPYWDLLGYVDLDGKYTRNKK